MKTELSLHDIKAIAVDILKHFKFFCEKNRIRFYLSNGTLLGSIKYGGFIPWDDDIDVLVPREDYDRLIRVYRDSSQYRLFSPEREQAYKFPFAKLCDITTRKEEHNIDNGISLGIDIDIFPIDECSDHIFGWYIQRKIKYYHIGCMLSKFISAKGKPFYKRMAINYCRSRGFDFFHHRLTMTIKKEILFGNNYKGCLTWPIYGEREIIPAEVFSDTITVEFEGEKFPAPIGYDTYLRSLYGDYEKDPPPEKQKSHHRYTAYRL